MISALDEQGSVARCIEAGAEDYLPKGVDPVLLRARMGACLRKKRARDQELAYLRDVRVLTAGAAALQAGEFDGAPLDAIAGRLDALGTLARVFVGMAREVRAASRDSPRRWPSCGSRSTKRGRPGRWPRSWRRTTSRISSGAPPSCAGRRRRAEEGRRDMARVISVHSFRGGTGKSNIAASLATALALQGRRVAVVDTDIQSPGIHILFGLRLTTFSGGGVPSRPRCTTSRPRRCARRTAASN